MSDPTPTLTRADIAGIAALVALVALISASANVFLGLVLGCADTHYPAAIVFAVIGFFASILAASLE